jgi:arginine/lysine/ornithine decarboxylase
MHTSTSPQYAIIASCDIAAAMMEPPGGTALVEESIIEALDFRRAMRKVDEEWGKDWWFKVWGPEKTAQDGIGSRDEWMLKSNEKWHGFGNLAPGFNMLDPIKATVITPGLDVSGKFAKTGIPASIVTKYLAEHGVIVEKAGLYSFFIMFTIGITKGRWNTLVTALQQFKDDYDKNQPIWRALPEFCQKFPRYERMGLRDLCEQIHGMYRANDVARLTTEMYLSDMQPAMPPGVAWARMAHRRIERVAIDQLEGRVASVLLTPYPPGIPFLPPKRPALPPCRSEGEMALRSFDRAFQDGIYELSPPRFLVGLHQIYRTRIFSFSPFCELLAFLFVVLPHPLR